MKLSDVMIRCLQEEQVDTIFGYPGAAVIDIYESLRTSFTMSWYVKSKRQSTAPVVMLEQRVRSVYAWQHRDLERPI